MDLKHINQSPDSDFVPVGIDLSEFLLSVEWDLLEVPATRNEEYYPCCLEPYAGTSAVSKFYTLTDNPARVKNRLELFFPHLE